MTLKPAYPSLPVITREKLVNRDARCCSSPIKEFDSLSNKTPKMRLKATKTPPPRSWREIAAHEAAAVCKQALLLCDSSVFAALNELQVTRPVSSYVSVLALLLVLTSCFTLAGFRVRPNPNPVDLFRR